MARGRGGGGGDKQTKMRNGWDGFGDDGRVTMDGTLHYRIYWLDDLNGMWLGIDDLLGIVEEMKRMLRQAMIERVNGVGRNATHDHP